MVAALAAVVVKTLAAGAGESGYVLMMLAGWATAVLLVANWPIAEQLGRALFDGQLYFTGGANLALALASLGVVGVGLARPSKALLLARLFPDFFRARGHHERRYHFLFDVLAAGETALATTTIGVMAAFALLFVPPWFAYLWGGSWRAGMTIAVVLGALGHCAAFALALAFDQPYGPLCALVLMGMGATGAALSRVSAARRRHGLPASRTKLTATVQQMLEPADQPITPSPGADAARTFEQPDTIRSQALPAVEMVDGQVTFE